MSNDDLAAFLLARIAEDEQVVIAAPGTEGNELYVLDDDYRHNLIVISRTRVLAECEAKRRIVELHHSVNDGDCATCIVPGWGYPTHGGNQPALLPCITLRLLTLPYASHPDYREEWRP